MRRTQIGRALISGLIAAGCVGLPMGTAEAQQDRPGLYEQRDRAPSPQTYTGTLEQVDGRDVIVRIGNNELRTFRLDRGSDVFVNGREASPDRLRPGERVRVRTTQDIGWYASRGIDPFIREIETLRTLGDSQRTPGLPEPEYEFRERERDRRQQRDRIAQLRENRPAGLGVVLESAANHQGVLVLEVYRDSPADEAGIRRGDFILSIDAMDVYSPQDLMRTVRRMQPGNEVRVTISRDGEERTVTPVLSTRSDALSEREQMGMQRHREQFARDRFRADRIAPPRERNGSLYYGGYGPPTYYSGGQYREWRPDGRRRRGEYGAAYQDSDFRRRDDWRYRERIENSRADRMTPRND